MDILRSNSPDSNSEKCCTKCGRAFPPTNEFFALAKTSKDGLTSACKDCNNVAYRLKHPDAKPRGKKSSQVNVPEGYRRCTHCKNVFPATPKFFNRNKRVKCGLFWQCKTCKQQLDMEYRMLPESKERIKEYRSTPERKELDRVRHRSPKAMAHVRKYHKRPEIRQRLNVYQRERYHHPEIGKHIHALHNAHNHTRRARKKTAPGFHTPEQIQEQYARQKGKCYYCQHKVAWGKHHVDHVIPLSRGGSNDISNLVIACATCNLRKNSKLPHEWPEGGRLL